MERSLVVATVLLLASFAGAVSRNEFSSGRKAALAPVYRNDGNAVGLYVITPTTHTWTQVRPALATRRMLHVEMVNGQSNGVGVCLSSTTAAGDICSDTRAGYELLLTTPQAHVDLFGETAWYARIRGGDGNTARLRAVEYSDSGD